MTLSRHTTEEQVRRTVHKLVQGLRVEPRLKVRRGSRTLEPRLIAF